MPKKPPQAKGRVYKEHGKGPKEDGSRNTDEKNASSTLENNLDFSKLKRETEDIEKLSTKKYASREIKSNWAKYENEIGCIVDESEEVPNTKDFNFLLSIASTDCNNFQFSSERNWEKQNLPQPTENSLFKLNLQVLSSGLSCIPVYKSLDMDKSLLTDEDVERCDRVAKENWNEYLKVGVVKQVKNDEKKEVESKSKVTETLVESNVERPVLKETPVSANSDNLEDWLDSILDD